MALSGASRRKQIPSRQYESAEANCAEINWLYRPGAYEDEIKQYDKVRESLLSQIRSLKQNSR
jgi:hypothetical protein